MPTLRDAVYLASQSSPLALTFEEFANGKALFSGSVAFRDWSITELSKMRVSRTVLSELVRRDVSGLVLNGCLGENLRHVAPGLSPGNIARALTARQVAWMIGGGPASIVEGLARDIERPAQDRVAAAVALAERCQAPLATVRDVLNTLNESDWIQDALERISRADVLTHFALGTKRHCWRPAVAERLLELGVMPVLASATPAKVIAFVRTAALRTELLDALLAHRDVKDPTLLEAIRERRAAVDVLTMRVGDIALALAAQVRALQPEARSLQKARAVELVIQVRRMTQEAPGTWPMAMEVLATMQDDARLDELPAVLATVFAP